MLQIKINGDSLLKYVHTTTEMWLFPFTAAVMKKRKPTSHFPFCTAPPDPLIYRCCARLALCSSL